MKPVATFARNVGLHEDAGAWYVTVRGFPVMLSNSRAAAEDFAKYLGANPAAAESAVEAFAATGEAL